MKRSVLCTQTALRLAGAFGGGLLVLTLTLTLTLTTAPALAAGFQLNETSAAGLGNAFAGGAAGAEDASAVWSNVAAMARLRERQVVGALHVITPAPKFSDDGSVAASQQALGGNGGNAGGPNVVPNLYLVVPISDAWAAGLGLNSPWGLVTEYDAGWVGRFQALKSSIQTLNVNPGVSWRPASQFALGLGLNLQRIQADFTNQVNYSAALLNAAALNGITPGSATFNAIAGATPGLETSARIKGADNGTGWNIGLLWEFDAERRLGVAYRSSLKYQLKGSAHFVNPTPVVAAPLAATVAALAGGVNATALYDSGVTADVKMPPIFNLSYFGSIGGRWDVMADAQWTGWSTVETLSFVRSDGTLLQSTPENFKNVWKLALGVNFRPGGDWMWRGGLAVDKSPVPTEWRTPRLPDADRTWLAAGAQYRFSPALKLDMGAGYLWVRQATINTNGSPASTAANALLHGHYANSTTILSGQMAYTF